MLRENAVFVALGVCLVVRLMAQTPSNIDFGRDVLPIFRQNCFACHGPSQQMNGLRLDRRSSVLKSGARRVVPGSSENSFLYHRVAGTEYGPQMPLTGPLRPEQIAIVRAWIDRGAEWPDALANETAFPPPDPKAVAMVNALRADDRESFLKFVAADPKLINARGPDGSTPFMYAVLYSDVAMLDRLMKTGADPNARDRVNATPLLWAATDFEKTRLLLADGAELNARSDDMRTPLMVAAGHPGGARIVRLLLDHGANPNPATNPAGAASPLTQAAAAGDAESMQLLLDHGAEVKDAGGIALSLAVAVKCSRCVDLLLKRNFDKEVYTGVLPQAAFLGDLRTARLMLDRGAAVNAVDSSGRTALMSAAVSDLLPLDVVKLLIERGADVNARSQHPQSGDTGLTVLDIAKLHGETPVVDFLIHSGATGVGRTAAVARPQPAKTVRGAIERSLPLLQRGDAGFSSKSGCISCHNNSLGAMAIGLGRRNGFRVDEQIAAQQVKANVAYIERQRTSLHQSFFATQAGDQAAESILGPFVLAYVLVGLNAEHYKADLNTDAVAIYLKAHQIPDGHWAFPIAADRPPICSHYAGQTALCMRALQLYRPRVGRPEYEKSIAAAAQWLAKVEATTNQDRFWRLLGLAWAAQDPGALQHARREVLALQRPDGGWSDLPSLESNAYATGMALNALHTSGLPPSDPAYKRGVEFLLNTQLEDGSWHVKTRALGGQPYFDAGFPHGVDQFISAAATGWATIALIPASPTAEIKSVSGARN